MAQIILTRTNCFTVITSDILIRQYILIRFKLIIKFELLVKGKSGINQQLCI